MSNYLLLVFAAYALLMVSCYVGGYLASCGWHRRKREFLQQMVSEVTDGESNATARV
jgi:hypothetical protein